MTNNREKDDVDLVFWPASVRMHGIEEHIAAAAAGGFNCLAIAPETFAQARAQGISARTMQVMASDRGIRISHLDTLTDWAPIRLPQKIDPALKRRFDVSADDCFNIVESFGIKSILAVAGFDEGTVSLSASIDGFGRLCERAAQHEARVELEFMPLWGVPDLASAWDIVGGARMSNGGILVDTWHFVRAKCDIDLLRSLPDQYFTGVQVGDGLTRLQGQTLLDDRTHYCLFPGEGELPIIEVIHAVYKKGHLRHIGPEVYSDDADCLTPAEAGRRSWTSLQKVMSAAGIATRGKRLLDGYERQKTP